MTRSLPILKLSFVAVWLALGLACGTAQQNQSAGNTGVAPNTADASNANASPSQANSNGSQADMATMIAQSQKAINLPPANPIQNPKPYSFYSDTIFFDIPAQWKKADSSYNSIEFKSPDGKLELTASVRETEKAYKNMSEEFRERLPNVEKDGGKLTLMPVGGTPGILMLDADKPDYKTNYISWESYPTPDSAGKTRLLTVSIFFPKGEFEQHKQLISDLFGSVRLKRQV